MSLNLQLDIKKTNAGVFAVTYGYLGAPFSIDAPLNIQEAAFVANGLEIVSPAQLGFLRVNVPDDTFNPFSRSCAEVLYDDRDGRKVIVLPNGGISRLVGIDSLAASHGANREYVIPENQRGLIYDLVDEALKNGTVVRAHYGQKDVSTARFGEEELTSRLYSSGLFGFKANDLGDWLQSKGRDIQSFCFDGKEYAYSKEGPYLNRLRLYGSAGKFCVVGGSRYISNLSGAFGVRFEKTTEGGGARS